MGKGRDGSVCYLLFPKILVNDTSPFSRYMPKKQHQTHTHTQINEMYMDMLSHCQRHNQRESYDYAD